MEIRILKDTLTTIDNFILREFKAGEVCDVRESAGCRLIMRGDAELLGNNHEQYTIFKHG